MIKTWNNHKKEIKMKITNLKKSQKNSKNLKKSQKISQKSKLCLTKNLTKSQQISTNLKKLKKSQNKSNLMIAWKNKGAKPSKKFFFVFFHVFWLYIACDCWIYCCSHLSFRDSQDAAASFAEPVGNDDHNINIFIEAHLCRFPHRWNRNISYIEFCFLWCFWVFV